jgi:hypothetical protein
MGIKFVAMGDNGKVAFSRFAVSEGNVTTRDDATTVVSEPRLPAA